MTLIGGIEGGGTKFVAAVAEPSPNGPPSVVEGLRVDTTPDPAATIAPISAWLADHDITRIGVAMFGPLDLESGEVGATPKEGWAGARVGELLPADIPAVFDTDVNAAALAEWRWGAAQGTSVAVYLTVGTGIGGGAVVDGSPIHGRLHPEMGHVPVPRFGNDDLGSRCPHHDACLEGLASGAALAARLGERAETASPDDPIWDLEAHYLAHGLHTLTLVLSPEVVVLGGGVMQHDGLLAAVDTRLRSLLGGYVPAPRVLPPEFGQEAGLFGALALAAAS